MERRKDVEVRKPLVSRNSSGVRSPIKRQGSRLEVLPPEEDEQLSLLNNGRFSPKLIEKGCIQNVVNTETREVRSARTTDGQSRNQGVLSPISRCSSDSVLGMSLDDENPPRSPSRKQVILPTVKRNPESHGKPKKVERNKGDNPNSSQNNFCIESEDVSSGGLDEAADLMEEISLEETSYASNGMYPSNSDSYYISHTPALPPPSHSSGSDQEGCVPLAGTGANQESDSSSSDEEEGEEDEETKAPLELMGEFLQSVMDEDYEVAEKLCTMIQIYEPNNPECLQFKPLIEEMLKREREAELWGSGSEESSSEEDSSDGGESDNDEDDDNSVESSEEDSDDESSEEPNSDSASLSR